MNADDILLEAEESMEKSVTYMTHEFSSVRTGKASPALVENIDVEAYGGTNMKLKQLALITTPEPRLLVIQPFDAGMVKDSERGRKESRLGIQPIVDGKIIRRMAEDARVRVRGNRRSGIDDAKKIKKEGALTEDQLEDIESSMQKLTDQYIKSIDSHLASKEAEVMKV